MMTKKTMRPLAVYAAVALALSSLPIPAFCAMSVRAQANVQAAPGLGVLPAVQANLGGGTLRAASGRASLSGSLTAELAPVPGASVLSGPAAVSADVPALAAPEALSAAPAAAPAAASAAPASQAAAPAAAESRGVLGRLVRAVARQLAPGRVFDNAGGSGLLGILPTKQDLPAGLVLDREPSTPDPRRGGGVFFQNFDMPGLAESADIFAAGAKVLQADPASEADVEAALRALVDSDPARFGVSGADLATVHVKRVAGKAHQADTIYALFRQQKDGLQLYGTSLSFTVKVIRGQPVVLASEARLYPTAPVKTAAKYSDEELREKALKRLGPIAEDYGVEAGYIGRQIAYVGGAWRAVNLYFVEGAPLPLVVAVDVATGEAFTWDARSGRITEGEPTSGRVLGRTTDKGPTRPDSALVDRPLPDVNVTLGDGKVVVTDSEGRFTLDSGLDGLAAQFKAVLAGKWSRVSNAAGGNLEVSGQLEGGKEATVTFNPEGMNEEAIAQVNGYLLTTLVHDWVKTHGIDDKRVDYVMPVKVNIDQECNAYYTRWSPSLNFFRSSEKCVNSSYDTVVMHEYGHFIDDMIGGIVNSGLSEGWGDIFSMFILNNPIIGEKFFKQPKPDGRDYIRHGENTYQYKSSDEVHAQGQAWGGFAWKLRKTFISQLGEAAGAALAEALVMPTIFAKARDIPAAMAQVLLNDMDANGVMPHEAEIRAAAKVHGIELPKSPKVDRGAAGLQAKAGEAPQARDLRRVISGLERMQRNLGRRFDAMLGIVRTARRDMRALLGYHEAGLPVSSGYRVWPGWGVNLDGMGDGRVAFQEDGQLRATMTFSVGVLYRARVKSELEKYLDQKENLTYKLKEYKGWLSSDFLLVVEGPADEVKLAAKTIEAWFRAIGGEDAAGSNFAPRSAVAVAGDPAPVSLSIGYFKGLWEAKGDSGKVEHRLRINQDLSWKLDDVVDGESLSGDSARIVDFKGYKILALDDHGKPLAALVIKGRTLMLPDGPAFSKVAVPNA